MMGLQQLFTYLLLVALLSTQCYSFQVAHRSSNRIATPQSPLFGSQNKLSRRTRTGIFMTAEESKDQDKTDAVEETPNVGEETVEEQRTLAKSIFLAVPLFCKFLIVLLIKFVTDLVVFPLLFLYRQAGKFKRMILGNGSKDKFGKVNGE